MMTNSRPQPDDLLVKIADYVDHTEIHSDEAYQTARLCLADALGCAILALKFPACTKLLGPVVANVIIPNGARVLGTTFVLDPIRAAFNLGTMIRWLDYNDTFLAAEWGHPSDNLGGLLAMADYLCRQNRSRGAPLLKVKDLLTALIKAYEIQGGLSLQNSFNRVGLDHVILVKVATTAVVTKMLGGDRNKIIDALSQAWIDLGPMRTYRHAPNTGSRKSWAAGDATSRGVALAMLTMQSEMGYPTVLTAPKWGLYDVLFDGKPFIIERPFGSYVIENILFKVSFPAEFHAQTALEGAIKLHPQVKERFEDIEKIVIHTQDSAARIIDKTGPLHNPADRDHCIQYMVAIGLLKGNLTAEDYEDQSARDSRIDTLRAKMQVVKKEEYSKDYLHPEKRSIANAITIYFKDGSSLPMVEVEFPIGHKRRRHEATPLLFEKFAYNLSSRFPQKRVDEIVALFQASDKLDAMDIDTFVELFI